MLRELHKKVAVPRLVEGLQVADSDRLAKGACKYRMEYRQMDTNPSQIPMTVATAIAAKKAFRKVVKETLKCLEGESIRSQCKLF